MCCAPPPQRDAGAASIPADGGPGDGRRLAAGADGAGAAGDIGLSDEPPPPGALRDRWDSLVAIVTVAEELADADPAATAGDAGRRTRPAGRGAARADRRGRDAGLPARRQGAGMGRGVPGRPDRRDDADPARRDAGGDRGGAPAVLRRRHPGPDPARAVLGAVPHRGWPADPAAEPVPHRHRPGLGDPRPGAARPAVAGSAAAGCSPRRRSRSAGAPTARPAPIPELVDALRTWRKARSTEASVPAFVVFSDATLLAIAERRPTDNAALLSIPGHRPRRSWTPTARTSSGSSAGPADRQPSGMP